MPQPRYWEIACDLNTNWTVTITKVTIVY